MIFFLLLLIMLGYCYYLALASVFVLNYLAVTFVMVVVLLYFILSLSSGFRQSLICFCSNCLYIRAQQDNSVLFSFPLFSSWAVIEKNLVEFLSFSFLFPLHIDV